MLYQKESGMGLLLVKYFSRYQGENRSEYGYS